MKYNVRKVLILLVISLALQGCYLNEVIQPNQMAVQLIDGKISSIQGPGGKYNGGLFAQLVIVDIDTLTFSVEDPEVLTSDNQAVGMNITIQARRKSDTASITNLVTNWYNLINNDQLKQTISATAREGLKNGVRGFTLSQLLNDRNALGDAVQLQLEEDAKQYSVEIINVTIENVAPSAEYMQILSDKANLTAETAKELERQKLIEQQAANAILQAEKDVEVKQAQLAVEEAKTAVEVEIAQREGEKIAAGNAVYSLNEQAFELERLRLMALIYGDKTMFISPGTNLFINPGNLVPIQ